MGSLERQSVTNMADIDPAIIGAELLPSQFYDQLHRSADRTPEQRLMAAILEDALYCYLGSGTAWAGANYHCQITNKNERLRLEAERWLFGSFSAPLNFEMVCAALGLDPGWIRRELRRPEIGPRGVH